jgi:CheY-like chemotaxis protein
MTSVAFANPLEALEALKRGETYDVAVLDMHMPEMDGVQLSNEIRKNGVSIPLIMLTSLGWRDQGDTLNFAAFLTKPVKQSNLYNTIVGVLATQSATPKRASAEPQFDPQMAERNPLKILLAEDNAVNQKLAIRLLERFGYRPDVAGNGLEVLESLERQQYDVIFMDVQMPEMDGLEATRQIRAQGSTVHIVAMTANAMQGDREECLAAGMNDYVGKPIKVNELQSALERAGRK